MTVKVNIEIQETDKGLTFKVNADASSATLVEAMVSIVLAKDLHKFKDLLRGDEEDETS